MYSKITERGTGTAFIYSNVPDREEWNRKNETEKAA